jgi:hypothetical protein
LSIPITGIGRPCGFRHRASSSIKAKVNHVPLILEGFYDETLILVNFTRNKPAHSLKPDVQISRANLGLPISQ